MALSPMLKSAVSLPQNEPAMPVAPDRQDARIRVWDLPTRIFHWLLAICVVGAYVSVKVGGPYMAWHVRFGSTVLALVLFRIVWGLVGPRYARFSQFVVSPRAALEYLKGGPSGAGHNPLGGYSVIAMLAVFTFQGITGLFADDEIDTQGPLMHYVDITVSGMLTGLHRLDQWLILALVLLHVLAICWYTLVRRQRLIRPMITGDAGTADLPAGTSAARDDAAVWLKALVIAAVAAGIVLWIWSLQGTGDA